MSDRELQIKSAATALFLKQGVAVSTASIAKAAGVSNGTLFNAFASKQLLIDSLYQDAKSDMFSQFQHSGPDPFSRSSLYENWTNYLTWGAAHPERRRVMHLLYDAGLASDQTQAEVAKIAEPHTAWIAGALNRGIIRGPNVPFTCKFILYHMDLAISENLASTEADMAFDMLCAAIGLQK